MARFSDFLSNAYSQRLWIAIGIDEYGDGFLKLSEPAARTFWDVELSLEERQALMAEAAREGWELDKPLY